MKSPRRRLLGVLGTSVFLPALLIAGPARAAAAPTGIEFAYVAGSVPRAGQLNELQAALFSPPDAVPGRVIALYAHPAGSEDWSEIAEGTTDSSGSALLHFRLQHTSILQFRFAGDADYAETRTDAFVWRIAPQVSARLTHRPVVHGHRAAVVGRSWPAKPGQRVTLWSGSRPDPLTAPGRPPVRLATAVVRADGSYRIVHVFRTAGFRRLFVSLAAGGGNTTGYSNYLRVYVR